MTEWKKLKQSNRVFDDKQVITTRTILSERVQRKVEPLGRQNVGAEKKAESSTAKKYWITAAIIVVVVILLSVFA